MLRLHPALIFRQGARTLIYSVPRTAKPSIPPVSTLLSKCSFKVVPAPPTAGGISAGFLPSVQLRCVPIGLIVQPMVITLVLMMLSVQLLVQ